MYIHVPVTMANGRGVYVHVHVPVTMANGRGV